MQSFCKIMCVIKLLIHSLCFVFLIGLGRNIWDNGCYVQLSENMFTMHMASVLKYVNWLVTNSPDVITKDYLLLPALKQDFGSHIFKVDWEEETVVIWLTTQQMAWCQQD